MRPADRLGRRLATVALGAGLLVVLPVAALAQSWATPSPAFQREGVRAMVCGAGGHAAPCLGLACKRGVLILVNAAGGGGPMDGPTIVSTGRARFTLRFAWDEGTVDRLGVATSGAALSAAQAEGLLAARSLALTLAADPRIRQAFPVRGLSKAGRRAAEACR